MRVDQEMMVQSSVVLTEDQKEENNEEMKLNDKVVIKEEKEDHSVDMIEMTALHQAINNVVEEDDSQK